MHGTPFPKSNAVDRRHQQATRASVAVIQMLPVAVLQVRAEEVETAEWQQADNV
jgi:hypothetical protein